MAPAINPIGVGAAPKGPPAAVGKTIEPIAPPVVTTDEALASVISVVLQGQGDGGAAAVVWHNAFLKAAKAKAKA